jgi:cytochrome P450
MTFGYAGKDRVYRICVFRVKFKPQTKIHSFSMRSNSSLPPVCFTTAEHEGRVRMMVKMHKTIFPFLAPQNIVDASVIQLNYFSDYVNRIENNYKIDLFRFMTRGVTAATMETFYGPHNPFSVNPTLMEKFWDYDRDLVAFATNIFPWITARKAYQGWKACVQGFVDYIEMGRYEEAHRFVQERKALHDEYGLTVLEQAKQELGLSLGLNSNASVTSFWVVNHIFSSNTLLSQIRAEIQVHAFTSPNKLFASKLNDCQLLNSVFRETMRLIAPMTSARLVLKDTFLNDTYLLRKDSTVQIVGDIMHSEPSIWGPDAASFNPRRFLYSINGSRTNLDGSINPEKSSRIHPAVFRGFGGGVSLCPGRHFAQMEILGLCAVLAMGFDLEPMEGEGNDWNPGLDVKLFPLGTTKPDWKVQIPINRRKEFNDI